MGLTGQTERTINRVRSASGAIGVTGVSDRAWVGSRLASAALETVGVADRGWVGTRSAEAVMSVVPPMLSGAVLLLRMDEGKGDTAYDLSDEGNDGTITGAAWVVGKYGKALEFVPNNYVAVPHTESLNITDAIGIGIWIKPESGQITHAQPFTKYSHDWKIRLYGGRVYCAVSVGGLDNQYGSSFTYADDEWIYIFFTYSSTTRQIITYKNGVQQTPVTLSGLDYYTLTPTTGTLYIGCAALGERHYKGIGDEVSVYNRAPDKEEVKLLWRLGASRQFVGERDASAGFSVSGVASGIKTIFRTASAALGVSGVAGRAVEVSRSASASVGMAGTAVREWIGTRISSASIGAVAVGTRFFEGVRTAVAAIDLVGTAGRLRNVIRIAVASMSQTGTAVREWIGTRSAEAVMSIIPPILSNAVLQLHMDEGKGNTVYDSSGEGNDGTIVGASWVDGKFGKALGFNVGDYIDIPHHSSLNCPSGFTISLWVKLLDNVATKYPVRKFNEYTINLYNRRFYGYIYIDGAYKRPNPIQQIVPGIWCNLLYTYEYNVGEDKSYVKTYINAVLDNQGSWDGQADITDNSLTFPINYDSLLDDVRIYNRTFSEHERKLLWRLGAQRKLHSFRGAPASISQVAAATRSLIMTRLASGALTVQGIPGRIFEGARSAFASISSSASAKRALILARAQSAAVGLTAVGTRVFEGVRSTWAILSIIPPILSDAVLVLRMDEGQGDIAYDSSGEGNDGDIVGASWVDGKSKKALDFENAYVETPPVPNDVSAFSVACWIKTARKGDYTYYIHRGITEIIGSSIFCLGENANYLMWAVSGGFSAGKSSVLVPENVWIFLVGTYDGSLAKLYLNGNLIHTYATGMGNNPVGNKMGIGGTPWNPGYRDTIGTIDETHVYESRAISKDEVGILYNLGAQRSWIGSRSAVASITAVGTATRSQILERAQSAAMGLTAVSGRVLAAFRSAAASVSIEAVGSLFKHILKGIVTLRFAGKTRILDFVDKERTLRLSAKERVLDLANKIRKLKLGRKGT